MSLEVPYSEDMRKYFLVRNCVISFDTETNPILVDVSKSFSVHETAIVFTLMKPGEKQRLNVKILTNFVKNFLIFPHYTKFTFDFHNLKFEQLLLYIPITGATFNLKSIEEKYCIKTRPNFDLRYSLPSYIPFVEDKRGTLDGPDEVSPERPRPYYDVSERRRERSPERPRPYYDVSERRRERSRSPPRRRSRLEDIEDLLNILIRSRSRSRS